MSRSNLCMVKTYRRRSPKKFKTVPPRARAEMDQPAAVELPTMWKSRKVWTSILLFVLLFVTPGMYRHDHIILLNFCWFFDMITLSTTYCNMNIYIYYILLKLRDTMYLLYNTKNRLFFAIKTWTESKLIDCGSAMFLS